jgi:hypothetical protein
MWSAQSACERGRKLVAIQTKAHACQQQSLADWQNFASKIDASYADAGALRFRRSLSKEDVHERARQF